MRYRKFDWTEPLTLQESTYRTFRRLDMDKFEEAANLLRGVHDFKAFSFQPRETDDTLRNMEINVIPANETSFAQERSNPIDIYHVHFKSRAFLHNQVSIQSLSSSMLVSLKSSDLDHSLSFL